MIINIDRKNRSINLSIKAKDIAEETEAMQQLRAENAARERRHDQPGRAAAGQARQAADSNRSNSRADATRRGGSP